VFRFFRLLTRPTKPMRWKAWRALERQARRGDRIASCSIVPPARRGAAHRGECSRCASDGERTAAPQFGRGGAWPGGRGRARERSVPIWKEGGPTPRGGGGVEGTRLGMKEAPHRVRAAGPRFSWAAQAVATAPPPACPGISTVTVPGWRRTSIPRGGSCQITTTTIARFSGEKDLTGAATRVTSSGLNARDLGRGSCRCLAIGERRNSARFRQHPGGRGPGSRKAPRVSHAAGDIARKLRLGRCVSGRARGLSFSSSGNSTSECLVWR